MPLFSAGAAGAAVATAAAADAATLPAANVDRLVGDIEARNAVGPRRERVDESVGGGAYVNEANRKFLTQVGKSLDPFTLGIRQALERGTA